jgi:hypothetical protein
MTNNYSFEEPVIMRCKVIDQVLPNTYEFRLTSFGSTRLKKKPTLRIFYNSTTLISNKKVRIVKRNLKLAINEDRLSMFSDIKNGNMFYPYWVYDESWNRVL